MIESDQHGGETAQKEMADETVDVVGTIEPENAEMYIDAGPLYVGFSDGVTGGLRVLQDGDFLAISQGVDYPDGDRATVGHDLTPDEAREFAEMLMTAADDAEEAANRNSTEKKDSRSLLRRLVS